MTEEINKQEQMKRQNGLWTGLTVGMVMLVGLITLSGCGNNAASNANTNTSAEKIYKAEELAALALADNNAWTGREVTVTGYIVGTDDPGRADTPGYRVTLKDEGNRTSKNNVYCKVLQGNMPEGMISKTVEVRGKIKSVESGELNSIRLEPCEVK